MSLFLYSVYFLDTHKYTLGHIHWKARDDRCWMAHLQQFESSTFPSSWPTSSGLNQNRMPQGLCSISTVITGVISLMMCWPTWSQGRAWWWELLLALFLPEISSLLSLSVFPNFHSHFSVSAPFSYSLFPSRHKDNEKWNNNCFGVE